MNLDAGQLETLLHGTGPGPTIPAQGQRNNGQGGSMARFRYQQGRLFLRGKRGSERWIGRFRTDQLQEDGSTKRIERSVILGTKKDLPTEKLARRRLELLVAPINSPAYCPGRVATIAKFEELWRREVLVLLKPSTTRAAVSHLKNHILPRLGKLRMDELGKEQQQAFVTYLARRVSRKTVLNVLGTLSSMLHTAKKWKYLCEQLQVSELTLPVGDVEREARFFTPEQVRQILVLAREPFNVLFAVCAMCGLRAGEALGLQKQDLDFAGRRIFIRRSVNRGYVQTVKSKASQRPVPMPEALAGILMQYLHSRQENPEQWLFGNRRGRPYSADKVVMFKLWPILNALGIPRCGLHAFRHFHSTMLLEVGAPPQVAQAQMRHSDARVTLEIYSHVIPESQRSAVEKVAELLRPSAPNSQETGEWIQ